MNSLHRHTQNLSQEGPVFSTKDEQQRVVAKEIVNGRIKPVQKVHLNQNITGLDRKPQFGRMNTSYYRLWEPLSVHGRVGFSYGSIFRNYVRFSIPVFCFASFYYGGSTLTQSVHWAEQLNGEEEKCYMKMQTYKTYHCDRISLMA